MKQVLLNIILLFSIISVSGEDLHKMPISKLVERQWISTEHTEQFEHLQVQDHSGRIKPMHTMALELLRKIHKKEKFKYTDSLGREQYLTPAQVMLGMQTRPSVWQVIPLIKVDELVLEEFKGQLQVNEYGMARPAQFFTPEGNYILRSFVDEAVETMPGRRSKFQNAVLKLDEKVNIVWGIMSGQFMKIFPIKGHSNSKWAHTLDTINTIPIQDVLLSYYRVIEYGREHNDWSAANEALHHIMEMQKKHASPEVLLSDSTVSEEIVYNKSRLFFYSLIGYTILGIVMLVFSFIGVFTKKKIVRIVTRVFIVAAFIVFIIHGAGLALRWMVSGHAPWTNGYEASVFIAWVGIFASIIYIKKSTFPLAAMSLIAVCLLGIAHGSLMNPEITNLVPVLKSYWLIVHVAVITASYAFLTLGSILALLSLLFFLMINESNKSNLLEHIQQLTKINQITSTIGLFLLTIGTFLGGIWANESWGRYWGWDPKETWALISIIVYAFVLHYRMIAGSKAIFGYNVLSLFALSSLIMTFYGVNYYLSGLHSYAKGDPVPIPYWIFVVVPALILMTIMAWYRKSRVLR